VPEYFKPCKYTYSPILWPISGCWEIVSILNQAKAVWTD